MKTEQNIEHIYKIFNIRIKKKGIWKNIPMT